MERARVVVLVSGSGTNLAALLQASADPSYPADIVAVGSDRPAIPALDRATAVGVETFVVAPDQYGTRAEWDVALADSTAAHRPDLVVLAGFMRLVGPVFLERFPHRVINTHPALSPSFAGMDAPRAALAHGVKVTGCTIFIVDEGVDTGPIVAQAAVPVKPNDDVETLHERIKEQERELLVRTVAELVTHHYEIAGRKVVLS
ncbi:MAG TPA: phosphoribosylglycinamide formyltransferase [Actinomycetes bacterium]|nr:phosphoribosylglycinamide formyltransferase [Actinomycetes bacterium]